jgi:hypothetical protein
VVEVEVEDIEVLVDWLVLALVLDCEVEVLCEVEEMLVEVD